MFTRKKSLSLILVIGLIALSFGSDRAQSTNLEPTVAQTPSAAINHVIWVWFENRESTQITAATAPYFSSFAATNANLTNFYAVSHPSQPNYLDGFSGANQGVTNDNHFTFPATTDNLAKQMNTAGKSWRVYAQNYPGGCSDADTFTGVTTDGPGFVGQYVRKHDPAISFESVRLDPAQCANIQPLANFDPTVNFSFVVPNMINDMHDGTTAQGDAFLQGFVPLVTASPDWAHTLLIVTFDEGTTNTNGGGHIYTAAAAPWLNSKTITATYNHFSMLHTIEQVFGLPFLGGAVGAQTINELLPPARTPYDYDGDGKSDISIFRPSTGAWYLLRSQAGLLGLGFGLATDKIAPADYDGDGKTDIALYRPSTNVWYIINSSTNTFTYSVFGTAEDLPAPADYDGDGKADISLFRPSTGTWYRLNSSTNAFVAVQFGANGDNPAVGDFDGDGKADISVFRPSTGAWYRLNSSDGSFSGTQFGAPGDQIVPADFDGDGKTDIAVWRPSNGTWYILNSLSGTVSYVGFGAQNDLPSPGDFDGDGKADICVFRPSEGTWYRLNSSNNLFVAQPFGANGDQPTPGALLY